MEHPNNIADAFITLDKYVIPYKLNQNVGFITVKWEIF